MSTLLRHVRMFLKQDDGATMAEYVVLAAVLIIGVIVAIQAFTDSVGSGFDATKATVDEAAGE